MSAATKQTVFFNGIGDIVGGVLSFVDPSLVQKFFSGFGLFGALPPKIGVHEGRLLGIVLLAFGVMRVVGADQFNTEAGKKIIIASYALEILWALSEWKYGSLVFPNAIVNFAIIALCAVNVYKVHYGK